MENKKNLKLIIIIIVVVVILFSLYFILNSLFNNKEKAYTYLKNYKVNEYIPTYVSDQDMAKIYLNDYINNMYSNIETAYNLLDEEYRNKKFGSLENYKKYVNSLKFNSYKISTYSKYNKEGYLVFKVTDTNGNMFVFKTNGVMQYSVLLDDYTVEI